MKRKPRRDNAGLQPGGVGKTNSNQQPNSTPPTISGQCSEVMELLRTIGPVLSFVLTADHAIPEAAARVYDLRAKGYRVITNIQPEVVFRGRIRRNAALYSLGVPEWIAPESQEGGAK